MLSENRGQTTFILEATFDHQIKCGLSPIFPSAHGRLQHLLEEKVLPKLNKYLKKYNVEVKAEVFRYEGGTKAPRRAKNSMGLDVVVINTTSGDAILAFDLKTGKSGTTKKKLPGYQQRFNGVPIIDVFVRRKK